MSGLIKEEILSVIKKKRFIILTVLAYIGVIITTVMTKNKMWNDLTYYFAIQEYLDYVFAPSIAGILIISVYRKKYTKNSIMQVEEHGVKRSAGVLGRFISGSVILAVCYLIMMILVFGMSFAFGANNTAAQLGELAIKMAFDCLACIAAYAISLFWLYLFAFPIAPVLAVLLLMFAVPYVCSYMGLYGLSYYQIAGFFVPKIAGDIAFTDMVYSNPQIKTVLAFLAMIVIPFLFSMLVFKLKKIKPKKKKKSKLSEDGEVKSEDSEVTPENVVITTAE